MDVHSFTIVNMAASNTYFQEQTSLSPDVNEKVDEHIFVFHLNKKIALENEWCPCISIDFQDMVMFQIIEDAIANFLHSSGKMNFIVFMDHENMFTGHLEFPIFSFFCLLKESVSRIQESIYLLDWLNERDHFT